eukprot:13599448-Alexandrium_andersonii.AAC.1
MAGGACYSHGKYAEARSCALVCKRVCVCVYTLLHRALVPADVLVYACAYMNGTCTRRSAHAGT